MAAIILCLLRSDVGKGFVEQDVLLCAQAIARVFGTCSFAKIGVRHGEVFLLETSCPGITQIQNVTNFRTKMAETLEICGKGIHLILVGIAFD